MTPFQIKEHLDSKSLTVLSDCLESIQNWVQDPSIDPIHQEEIKKLILEKKIQELQDRFYRTLEFGTGGMRGIQGMGLNRINIYVVRRSAQGIANYILKFGAEGAKRGVAIAYDCRINSREFAQEAACVLTANGIRTHLFPEMQTTPQLSYTIRKLQCLSGLCFTASHNPPNYNGMKVYWEDGAQIVPPQDAEILDAVDKVKDFKLIKTHSLEKAIASDLLSWISDSVIQSYQETVEKTRLVNGFVRKDFSISYTPLHGTGTIPTLQNLNRWGFENVSVVDSQKEPNGLFPTVSKPNPEEPAALKALVEHAGQMQSEVAFATDPDSDRLAMVVYDPLMAGTYFKHQALDSKYILLNGNQTGALLLNFICQQRQKQGSLSKKHAMIKTIVTSELLSFIAQKFQVSVTDTLTGFKWIAQVIKDWEKEGSKEFLFGTEESFGYMTGDYVRDKDGISALCMAADFVAVTRHQKSTVLQELGEIFRSHGSWQEDLINFDLEGMEGAQKIKKAMKHFREMPPFQMNEYFVTQKSDFLSQKKFQVQNSLWVEKTSIQNIPKSDVLQFDYGTHLRISLRPSGTEPKLKIYVSASKKPESAQANIWELYAQTVEEIAKVKNLLISQTRLAMEKP
jgi:phosphoglucomutase